LDIIHDKFCPPKNNFDETFHQSYYIELIYKYLQGFHQPFLATLPKKSITYKVFVLLYVHIAKSLYYRML